MKNRWIISVYPLKQIYYHTKHDQSNPSTRQKKGVDHDVLMDALIDEFHGIDCEKNWLGYFFPKSAVATHLI